MPEPYPLPSHAASFWIAGDDLWIAFPGQGPEERGHSIRLPASAGGLATAISIMRARSKAHTTDELKLGNRTPTRYDLETDKKMTAWLAALDEGKVATAAERQAAQAELEELGL
jgi:hypothetical protein